MTSFLLFVGMSCLIGFLLLAIFLVLYILALLLSEVIS